MPTRCLVLLAPFFAACAPKAAPPSTSAPPPDQAVVEAPPATFGPTSAPEPLVGEVPDLPGPARLPPPFTAAELRAAMPVGRQYTFRQTRAGGAPVLDQWTVVHADADGLTIRHVETPDGGGPAVTRDESLSWEALRDRAAFAAHATDRREDAEVTVDAGTFPVISYRFQGGDENPAEVRHYHFAPELPGPPVLVDVAHSGNPVFRQELVAVE